ncbi:MAG: hypothetical protein OJF61_002483 [Rhodanobacteraceae bacterium]|nr:MAG: hypothetical protein OJF61_002483 [Rhodanobacteraceae bacterium]
MPKLLRAVLLLSVGLAGGAGAAFAALLHRRHGSWNRSRKAGYRVVAVDVARTGAMQPLAFRCHLGHRAAIHGQSSVA